jgi:hypothetical protein
MQADKTNSATIASKSARQATDAQSEGDNAAPAQPGRKPGDRGMDAQPLSHISPFLLATAILSVALMLTSYPSFIIMAVGMAPTFVGAITQLEPNAYRVLALGFLNFSGVLPYLLDLWIGGNKLDTALRIIIDPYALLVMYGAAGLAVLVFWAAPQIAATILGMMATRRRNALLKTQDILIKEWGADVDRDMAQKVT